MSHKDKPYDYVCSSEVLPAPEWFMNGVKAALLASTAMNQQKFHFTLINGSEVQATTKGGFYTKTDLGIAKYFFELGAGDISIQWTK